MNSSSPKSKSGFRKFVRKKVDEVFKRKPSQTQSSLPASPGALSQPPHLELGPSTDPASTLMPTPRVGSEPSLRPAAPSTTQPTQPSPVLCGVWVGLEAALCALRETAQLFPPIQSAASSFINCLDLVQNAPKNREEREELALELTSLTDLLARHLKQSTSVRMSEAVAGIAHAIEEQAKIIEGKRLRGTAPRLLGASAVEEELSNCYRRIGSLFRRLHADANLSMWKIVDDQMANTRLEGLIPVKLASYNSKLSTAISRRTCTNGTRTAILSGLNLWANNSVLDIYWMNGMAGTGKTTIACTFSEALEQRNQLAASFFCTRTSPECREVTRILPTIAYQVARYSVPFKSALCESLQKDPDAGARSIGKQFELLLNEPLKQVKDAMPSNLVVVIDALDECNNMREVEVLLSTLLTNSDNVPIKFFVTSRPEPEIYNRMQMRGPGARTVLHLHEVEKSFVESDIELYLKVELGPMAPTSSQIKELVKRTGRLFIYAATLIRYIQPHRPQSNPHRRLQSTLSKTSVLTKQYAAIDELYMTVLNEAFEAGLDDEELEYMRLVIGTVVCAQEPISIATLTVLSGLEDEHQALAALQPLRPVLHISEANNLVSTLHTSFPDFIFDATRSGAHSCNLPAYNSLLAHRCFKIMESQLRFNICHLESSYLLDCEVDNLDERVNQAISSTLLYACRYWGDHLRETDYSTSQYTLVEQFLSNRLLFWMEVLNLSREMRKGVEVLTRVKGWMPISMTYASGGKKIEDARKFVTTFASNPVSQSTPHIYVSLLPFCPKSSYVFNRYYGKMNGLVEVTGTAMEKRETAALARWDSEACIYSVAYSPDGSLVAHGCKGGYIVLRNAHDGALFSTLSIEPTSGVFAVEYSPDGAHLASGSDDGTIRVWNAHDGALILGPLEGHVGRVLSLAYSPDGASMISGGNDCVIRVWDALRGVLIAGPIKGHSGAVFSVTYSPNGTRIASGSDDSTVRIWDVQSWVVITAPMNEHTSGVRSVAYSPDGTCIASGSNDHTIRVWDAQHGALVIDPLRGHTGPVSSVAYSPDGAHIISGSADCTIRVWDAYSGAFILGPLEGHTDHVWAVAHSPNDARIVSGSLDKTVRVWDVDCGALIAGDPRGHTEPFRSIACSPDSTRIASGSLNGAIEIRSARDGALTVGPMRGHAGSVESVSYSPDGTQVASGSSDSTILIWCAYTGVLIAGPLAGHIDKITSVVYSPDGTRIASGSADHTIRVWSVADSTLAIGPFEGHANSITSVAYSPDGSRIASSSYDHTVRVWNASDGTPAADPFEGHENIVYSVAYSPDGTCIASGSCDKTIRVWNACDGTLVVGPLGGAAPYMSVSYSPDGTRIASGSYDNTIRLWDARNGAPITDPLDGHTGWVGSVLYTPDGTGIISCSDDHSIRVWRGRQGLVDNDRSLTTGPDRPDSSGLKDGWVISFNSRLLFWMPPELQHIPISSTLCCPLVIGRMGTLRLMCDDLFLGDKWAQCYQS